MWRQLPLLPLVVSVLLSQEPQVVIPLVPNDSIAVIVFSPDGKRIATGDRGNLVNVWDVKSRRVLLDLNCQDEQVSSLAFSPDSGHLAVGGAHGRVEMWDLEQEIPIFAMEDKFPTLALAFSPDGTHLAVGYSNGKVVLLDAGLGVLRRVLAKHADEISGLAFSPDGKNLLSWGRDGLIKIDLDVPNNNPAQGSIKFEPGSPSYPTLFKALAFSADGKTFATCGGGNFIEIWDAMSGEQLTKITGSMDGDALIYSQNNKVLVVGKGDLAYWPMPSPPMGASDTPLTEEVLPRMEVYDINSGKVFDSSWKPRIPDGYMMGGLGSLAVGISPDGSLAATDRGPNIKIWDLARKKQSGWLTPLASPILAVAFSPQGKVFATGAQMGFGEPTVKIWDASDGRMLRSIDGGDHLAALAISPDGRILATGGEQATVKLWDMESGMMLRGLAGHKPWISCAAFSPDGKVIATSSNYKTVKLWDVATGNLIRVLLGAKGTVMNLAYSPDGKHIAAANLDRTFRIWDVNTGQSILTLTDESSGFVLVAYSPDGRWLAGAQWNERVNLLDAITGLASHTLEGHGSDEESRQWGYGKKRPNITGLAFSPDGSTLVTSCADRNIRWWDAKNGTLMNAIEVHHDRVNAIAFSPDGDLLLSGGGDGTVRFWRKGKLDATLMPLHGGGRVIWTPEGYYDDDVDGANSLIYRVGERKIPMSKYREALFNPKMVQTKLAGDRVPVPAIRIGQD